MVRWLLLILQIKLIYHNKLLKERMLSLPAQLPTTIFSYIIPISLGKPLSPFPNLEADPTPRGHVIQVWPIKAPHFLTVAIGLG